MEIKSTHYQIFELDKLHDISCIMCVEVAFMLSMDH